MDLKELSDPKLFTPQNNNLNKNPNHHFYQGSNPNPYNHHNSIHRDSYDLMRGGKKKKDYGNTFMNIILFIGLIVIITCLLFYKYIQKKRRKPNIYKLIEMNKKKIMGRNAKNRRRIRKINEMMRNMKKTKKNKRNNFLL